MVYILDRFSHRAKCTLLDLLPEELGGDLLMVLEKEQDKASENIGNRNADVDGEERVQEGGSPVVRVDSDESHKSR